MVKSSLEYESRKTTRRSKRRRASVDFSRASFCALHRLRARLCTTTSRVAGFDVRARASRARRPPTARARGSLRRATRGDLDAVDAREVRGNYRDARASSGARGARAARGRVDIARRRARGQTRARSIGGNARRARSIGEVGARAARARWLNIARGGDARERGERDARARARGGFAAD